MYIDKEYINNLADQIRKALDLVIPFKIEDVIKKINGEIIDSILEPSIDAIIRPNGNQFVIDLNVFKHQPVNRKRFTLAHELGHLFLHMGYLIDEEKWKRHTTEYKDSLYHRKDNNYSINEYEANEFAAAFLMPKDEFIKISESNLHDNFYDTKPISEHFQVSEEAVILRGKYLGIFAW